MMEYIAPLQQLIEQFRKLPGIGGKTAARLAFSVVGFSDEEARAFADAIIGVKETYILAVSATIFLRENTARSVPMTVVIKV